MVQVPSTKVMEQLCATKFSLWLEAPFPDPVNVSYISSAVGVKVLLKFSFLMHFWVFYMQKFQEGKGQSNFIVLLVYLAGIFGHFNEKRYFSVYIVFFAKKLLHLIFLQNLHTFCCQFFFTWIHECIKCWTFRRPDHFYQLQLGCAVNPG